MAAEIRKNSLIYRWFALYLRLGGSEKWESDKELFWKILVEAPILWLFSLEMDGNFRFSPVFIWATGVAFGLFWS